MPRIAGLASAIARICGSREAPQQWVNAHATEDLEPIPEQCHQCYNCPGVMPVWLMLNTNDRCIEWQQQQMRNKHGCMAFE